MTHRFPIKEIARQAGLGPATVDRVLNKRANVSPQSRARVERAVAELEGQEALLSARGRRLFFDFVIEAPTRFSREVKRAADGVAPHLGSAVCRSRFILQEVMTDAETVTILRRIRTRGSDGVCLKLRDTPKIRDEVNQLHKAGIPVVTLVTDLAGTARIAYAGLNNAGAGRTAAYLLSLTLPDATGPVLATCSSELFLGEQAREAAFVSALAERCPHLHVVSVAGGRGQDFETAKLITAAADDLSGLRAVYSMGGGNRSILRALADSGIKPEVFIAHDLDRDNVRLIQEGALSFVMHHDLTVDLRHVFGAFLGHHGLATPTPEHHASDVQVITPDNLPQQILTEP
ncbi:LacI family DNA-binding transcriptional regulator [Shimia sp.]|uniref:LacI family DNA-binding transcriptional regulator n=1 Tax=Shimia sp. TaxID=1954381 RepID=UPI003B8D3306